MIIRKIVTVIKLIVWRMKGIKVKVSIHSNIESSVCVYNHGSDLEIGQVYFRSNSLLNTDGDGLMSINDGVFVNRNSVISCRCRIDIGKNCIIGPNVCIYDHDHNIGMNGVEEGYKLAPVFIGENCWIGADTVILKGTRLGDNVIVAAGSVVRGDVPSNSLYYNERKGVIKPLINK